MHGLYKILHMLWTILNLINIWFSNHIFPMKKKLDRSDFKESIRKLPLYINECLLLQKPSIKKLAQKLAFEKSLLIIGKGNSIGTAKYKKIKKNTFLFKYKRRSIKINAIGKNTC